MKYRPDIEFLGVCLILVFAGFILGVLVFPLVHNCTNYVSEYPSHTVNIFFLTFCVPLVKMHELFETPL